MPGTNRYLAAGLLSAGAAAVFFLQVVPSLVGPEPAPEAGLGPPVPLSAFAPEGFLRFRTGDELTYELSSPEYTGFMDVRVLPQRLATAANQSRVLGLPLLFSLRPEPDRPEQGSGRAWDADVIDVERGGLLVKAEGCIVDVSLECREPEDPDAYLTWQACPFVSIIAPLDVIPRSALGSPRLQLQDPVKATSWVLSTQRLDVDRFRIAVDDVATQRPDCPFAEEFTVNVRTGLIEEARRGTLRTRLAAVVRGTGEEVTVGGGPALPSLLLPAKDHRPNPFPSGAENLGPAEWRLGEAWERAVSDSREFRSFLERDPDAFLFRATNSTSDARVLPDLQSSVAETVYEWRFEVLNLERELLRVAPSKAIVAGVPRYQTEVLPGHVPADVPSSFRPPSRTGAHVAGFVAAAAQAGFHPPARYADPSVTVLFDGEDADFAYSLFLGGTVQGTGDVQASVGTEWILLNGDTGRLTDAVLPRETARAMLNG